MCFVRSYRRRIGHQDCSNRKEWARIITAVDIVITLSAQLDGIAFGR